MNKNTKRFRRSMKANYKTGAGNPRDTAWNNLLSRRNSPHKYKGMNEKELAKYREQLERV